MDKKTAQLLIENTLNEKFNEDQFTIFAKNLLNDLEPKSNVYSGNLIWDDYKEHINSYKRIGKYIDPEGEALDVLIVEVKSLNKLERARTTLRNFVIKHLSKFEKDYALVAFYSMEDEGNDWRFSFIKLEYRSELDEEKGKVKTKKDFTPAKRYSFLVGKYEKTHTAKNQLLPLLQNIANNPTVEELESAFSIEKVTDEFFGQYKDLYIKLFEHFENDTHIKKELNKSNIDNARFTKKLLGQIVFLYFLQKKGWLGVAKNAKWGTGDKRFIQRLFNEAESKEVNFFKDKLQYLFYEALAKERENDNSFYKKLNCRIPFLNGGLFEADYDWKNANISIPTTLFRNDEKNKAGDIGTGALDVFDRYNFTIKEDEPLDKEVAVDPEMLGKVFENMLDVDVRKKQGAFYTPREIVHYMCQESLIHYLDNALNDSTENYQAIDSDQTNIFIGSSIKKGQTKMEIEYKGKILVPKSDIEIYIREGHFALENDQRVATKGESKTYQYQLPESVRQNSELIDKKLSEIRICDPAIGSGAFPVGLLHELVNAQLVLKPHFGLNYLKLKLDKFGFKERESVNESRYIYRLKRHIIQESIYGVDIDASAIDIARLRLWLSLVVDEDDLDPIETLPNLDYKIVCGNSLIGLPLQGADRYPQLKDELEILKKEFFKETNEKKKKTLRTKINEKIQTVLTAAEDFEGYKIDFDFKLFFSEVWNEKGGFDVVIGNPPYIKARDNNNKEARKLIEKRFKTCYKMWDIYIPFIELGIELSNNSSGSCSMIIPDTIGVADYTSKLTSYIENYCFLDSIVFFPNQYVFESAAVRNKIVLIDKITKSRKSKRIEYKQGVFSQLPFERDFDKYLYNISTLKLNFENSIKLGDICYVSYGLRLNSDKSDPQKFTKKDLISETKTKIHSKRYTEGKHLEKYVINKEFWIEWDTERCPKRLVRATFPELYEPEKLLLARQKKVAAFSDKGIICDNTIIVAVLHKELEIVQNRSIEKYYQNVETERNKGVSQSKYFNLKYLMSLINSSTVSYFLKYFTKGKIDVYPDDWKEIPIVKISLERQNPFIIMANYLLFLNKYILENDIVYQFYKTLIDCCVFELYFPNQLKIANKQILQHLDDLKSITDEMSEEEKLAIIHSEFELLYQPNHPVRFAIETIESIEEIRIIKEALK